MRVEIFSQAFYSEVQDEVNDWLNIHGKKIEVINIELAVSDDRHSVIIVYKRLK